MILIIIRTHGRTDNRIRSPRFTASSQWNNVGQGSRHNRSVTLGKGLALRVEWNEGSSVEAFRVLDSLGLHGSGGFGVWSADTLGFGLSVWVPFLGAFMGRLRGGFQGGVKPLLACSFRSRPQRTTNSELVRTRGIRLFN